MYTVRAEGVNGKAPCSVQKDESPMGATIEPSWVFQPVRACEHDVRPEMQRTTAVQGYNPDLGRAFSEEVSHDHRFRKAVP